MEMCIKTKLEGISYLLDSQKLKVVYVNMEQLEHLGSAGGNVNWYICKKENLTLLNQVEAVYTL